MVFPLQYSSLEESYPMWNIPKNSHDELPPIYNESDYLEDLSRKLKPFQKLRILYDKLEIDLRFPQYVYRQRSGDSRYKILEKLKEYKHSKSIVKIVELLCTTTYKNDTAFTEKCDIFYNKKIY